MGFIMCVRVHTALIKFMTFCYLFNVLNFRHMFNKHAVTSEATLLVEQRVIFPPRISDMRWPISST